MNQAWLFNQGKNYQSYRMLGARPSVSPDGESGYRFAVWAPRAQAVSVVGDFNGWDSNTHHLQPYGTTGIWQGFIAGASDWQRYKYAIGTHSGRILLKADPFARHAETRPGTASILYNFENDYTWEDGDYMARRKDALDIGPLNIYEVHLGSWRRHADGNVYSYRDIAQPLTQYLVDMGYNAVEFMPLTEYPFDTSWGYQATGYFAATSRYGTPADLKFLIDTLHRAGIRVILDWVPSHFPRDAFALARFDGEPLYEDPDPRRGEHDDWGTLVFNYALTEVRSFLLSSAWFWIDEFHLDGIRVDAVSSMIYLNFGRPDAEPNILGTYDHLEAIDFIKALNSMVREHFPHCIVAAEESTPYPNVTVPVSEGGLGFTHKWNMGWMNDTLSYMEADYYSRGQFHDKITFSMMYAFRENFILPFSHDEVVHGKKSLLGRMPGDQWRQFASLRVCYMYQMSHPGAKLNFMGNEFAPFIEWRYYEELEWFMLQYPRHREMQYFCRDLNHFYRERTSFWEVDRSWDGFKWLDPDDRENSVFSYARINADGSEVVVVILNMTPATFESYRVRVPKQGRYRLLLNSDWTRYGGSGYSGIDGEHVVFHTVPSAISKRGVNSGFYERMANATYAQDDASVQSFEHKNNSQPVLNDKFSSDNPSPVIDMPLPPLAGLYLLYEGDSE